MDPMDFMDCLPRAMGENAVGVPLLPYREECQFRNFNLPANCRFSVAG
jgi:hypothetical protein